MLSAKVSGESMIDRIVEDLKTAGGTPESYILLPLVAVQRSGHVRHVIRAEDFGVPQARHRVILMGIRADVFARTGIDFEMSPSLTSRPTRRSVASVLTGMPNLRSGLSKTAD